MFQRSDDALLLNTFNRLRARDALEHGIRAEALPGSASSRLSTESPDGRAEVEVGSLPPEFLTHGHATLVHQLLAPRRARRDACREGGDVVRRSHA